VTPLPRAAAQAALPIADSAPDPVLDGGIFDFPAKIQIQTINRCNYGCPMCPYPEVTAREAQVRLDGDLFRRLIGEVRDAGRRVRLCLMLQNEPLLDRRFRDFLDEAHRAEDAIASISTVTNGSVLTPELLDALMSYERFFLTVSVNSNDRERYLRIHGRDLWERVHGLLSGWRGRRDRVRVSYVLDAESVDDGRRFQRYWRGLGYATRMVPIFARVDTKTVAAPVHEIDDAYGHCHYPVDTLTVCADGAVILCCNDWLHTLQLGNLHEQTIAEAWNHPDRRRLRAAAVAGTLREEGMCRACDYPIRSSSRLRLEALVDGDGEAEAPAVRGGGGDRLPHAIHETAFRSRPDGAETPLLVWRIDERAGEVWAFAAREPDLAEGIEYELRIGHRGAFNFGALESVWCPARWRRGETDAGVEGAVPLVIALDPQAPAFAFFPWYCADWTES
jgi:radical SAM protein with 4Fe4S-binding SPASM domain